MPSQISSHPMQPGLFIDPPTKLTSNIKERGKMSDTWKEIILIIIVFLLPFSLIAIDILKRRKRKGTAIQETDAPSKRAGLP